jgi:5'-nucleotidase
MDRPPLDLAHARILISNDDSIHSTGIKVLETIARTVCDDVWVVAPEAEQSGASHSLTIHRPLRLRKYDERHFSVDGTPTDCVMLAMSHLLKDHRPDLVLSGINHGANVGDDVTYSGTVAVAMESTLLGVRAMAFSQRVVEGEPLSFAVPEQRAADLIRRLAGAHWADNVMLNINFPAVAPEAVTGARVVGHGRRKLGDDLRERFDPRGRSYFWIGPQRSDVEIDPDSDIAVVESGGISVTPIYLDLTHFASMPAFAEALGPPSAEALG